MELRNDGAMAFKAESGSAARGHGDARTSSPRRKNGVRPVTFTTRKSQQTEDLDMIDRARQRFLDALPLRLSFAQVASDLDLRPETLLAAYDRSRIKPRDHLRAARFDRLDQDLRAGRCEDLAQALVRWGFPAANVDVRIEYRRRYGRHPQKTLDAALAPRQAEAQAKPA